MLNLKINNNNGLKNIFCINDVNILNLEKKLFSFSSDKNYDYSSIILNSENTLPKLNINLSSIKNYYKNLSNDEKRENILKEEIQLINKYYKYLTSNIILNKIVSLYEQSIIYYLFYIMNFTLFYLLLSPNFSFDQSQSYLNFFENYHTIKTAAEIYLDKKKIKESYILLNKNELIDEYYELINYKEEFEKIILKFNYIISRIYILIIDKTEIKYDEKYMVNILEKYLFILNIFHCINEKYNIIDYTCFYNETISNQLIPKFEFKELLYNKKILNENICDEEKKKKLRFTLLNYTWLLNPSAKYKIITLFNEIIQIQQLSNNNNIDDALGILEQFNNFHELLKSKNRFFYIMIKRENIIEETLNRISKFPKEIHYPLKVKFLGEEGEDEGGVRKEFFMLIIRKLFNANYGMFVYNEKSRLFWFNLNNLEGNIQYEFIGMILGLALFNGVILDIKFPKVIYKKLLGFEPCLDDLQEYDEDLFNNLNFLKNTNDKNLKENLDSNFTVLIDKFGRKISIPLKPNGENIMIDYENKNEYVELYVKWFFTDSIKEYYESFEKGFYSVFDKNICKMLSPKELELIICGSPILDFSELEKNTKYEGYNSNSITIKFFWEILMEFSEDEKKKFLSFSTGCNKAPIGGLSSLPFTICRNGNINDLPSSHTCFNQLILPDYRNKEYMKKKIRIAINYSEGFGLA